MSRCRDQNLLTYSPIHPSVAESASETPCVFRDVPIAVAASDSMSSSCVLNGTGHNRQRARPPLHFATDMSDKAYQYIDDVSRTSAPRCPSQVEAPPVCRAEA